MKLGWNVSQQYQIQFRGPKIKEEPTKLEDDTKTEEDPTEGSPEDGDNNDDTTPKFTAGTLKSLQLSANLAKMERTVNIKFVEFTPKNDAKPVTPETLYKLQEDYNKANNIIDKVTDLAELLKSVSSEDEKLTFVKEFMASNDIQSTTAEELLKTINGMNSDNPIEKVFTGFGGYLDNLVLSEKQKVVDNYIKEHGLNDEQAEALRNALANGEPLGEIFGFSAQEMQQGLINYNVSKNFSEFS